MGSSPIFRSKLSSVKKKNHTMACLQATSCGSFSLWCETCENEEFRRNFECRKGLSLLNAMRKGSATVGFAPHLPPAGKFVLWCENADSVGISNATGIRYSKQYGRGKGETQKITNIRCGGLRERKG